MGTPVTSGAPSSKPDARIFSRCTSRGTLRDMPSVLPRWISAITACALLSAATPAYAQRGKKTEEDPKTAEAKKHMEAGAAFFNDPAGHKCEEAFSEFEKAYELVGSLNALKGMAFCAMFLERDGEAIELYETLLERKGSQIDRADKQQIESDLKALRAAVAVVTLKTDGANVVVVDTRTPAKGYPITNRYKIEEKQLQLGVHPGMHEIKASIDGQPEQVWRIEIKNGEAYNRDFNFGVKDEKKDDGANKPPPVVPDKPSRPIPKSVFIVGGATVALGIAGGVVGFLAKGAKDEFETANGKEADKAKLEEMRSKVVTMNLVADISFGLALAGAATTIVLFAKRPEKKPEAASGSLGFAPWATPQTAGAMVWGTF